jgi:hypothetical protein
MPRPVLTMEATVIRPGYAEAMSMLLGKFRDSGATLPELAATAAAHSRDGRSPRASSSWLLPRLKRLEAWGLVQYVRFPYEFLREQRSSSVGRRGKVSLGKWIVTPRGADFWDARLSVEIAKDFARAILTTSEDREHVTQLGAPTLLIVNCEPIRKDFLGLRLLLDGPTMGFTAPARATALQVWAQNPRFVADWKALQTLRREFPRDTSHPFTTPEFLALKAWKPAVRRAYRKVEKHRLVFCVEMNPAYWDNLPIEELEQLRKEYVVAKRKRDAAFARRDRAQAQKGHE